MRIARVQIEDIATPVVALAVDGAYYDVATLEETWSLRRPHVLDFSGSDFHHRVIAARCAGLDDLEARLLGGSRPTEARLLPGEYLPLPPCDTDRSYLVTLRADPRGALSFALRDARALVGHDQPAALAGDAPTVEGRLALILADDVWRAGAREAARAILGYSAVLDWQGAAHLGPELHTRLDPRAFDKTAWRHRPAEQLAFVSQHLHLRAGDVIALCPLWSRAAAFNERVDMRFGFLSLRGWVTPAPPPRPWLMDRS